MIEAQGGENKTKYGDMLIKKWSLKLVEQYGSGYNISNLKRMRQFLYNNSKRCPAGAPIKY